MPQQASRRPIPGLTVLANRNEPPGGWDPNEPAIQQAPADDLNMPPLPPAPPMPTWGGGVAASGPPQVEGTGLSQEGPAPVPGLSWRWSGQPPSASELANERTAFLGRGASPEIAAAADAIRGRQLADENIANNRPDLYAGRMRLNAMAAGAAATPEGQAAERARRIQEGDVDLATRGLQRAKMMGKIGVEDAMVAPNAFMRPESAAARRTATAEEIANETNPAYEAIKEREFQRQLQIHGVDAYGRILGSQMGGVLGGENLDVFGRFIGLPGGAPGGGAPAGVPGGMRGGPAGGPPAQGGPVAAGQTVPQARVEAFAKTQNLMFDQALAQVKAEGFKVQMNDGSIR